MTLEKATFRAGCFWGVEARFAALPGVMDTAAGYAGGETKHPTYEQVCGGHTGHAEVVKLSYDPAKIRYTELLDAFFAMHNPAQPYLSVRRDGAPSREQYRSVIFTYTEEQAAAARGRIAALQDSGKYPGGPATEVHPAPAFWRAEERHQQYFEKRNVKP